MCAASFARVSPEVFGLLVYFSEIDYERNKTGNVNIKKKNKSKFVFIRWTTGVVVCQLRSGKTANIFIWKTVYDNVTIHRNWFISFFFFFYVHVTSIPPVDKGKMINTWYIFLFLIEKIRDPGNHCGARDYHSWFRVDKPFSWYFFQTNLFRLRSSKVRLNFLFGYFSSCFDVFHRKRVSFFF